MRAVCFVKKLQWDLPGTLSRHSLTIGDVNNDGDNELVVGTAEGDLYIFKGTELWQKITGLGFITCVAIGDILNCGSNVLVVICGDGWVHIFSSSKAINSQKFTNENINEEQIKQKMESIHIQRIPANTKFVLIGDIDKDEANELIIGLTDRVVRSYRWVDINGDFKNGKLVALNKWESANQIGMITFQQDSFGNTNLLVAQPGGTFMTIKCNADRDQSPDNGSDDDSFESRTTSTVNYQRLGISRMRNPNISTEILGNLEPRSIPLINKSKTKDREVEHEGRDVVDGNLLGGNVILGEFDDSSDNVNRVKDNLVSENLIHDYIERKQKKLNENKSGIDKDEPKTKVMTKCCALATLDGTIILVRDDIILWAMYVDHQISALSRLDITGDGADEIIACTWDGQTYILDQQKNSVRFQFEEPVRGFCAGMYSVTPNSKTPCLVYNTFFNKIVLYYDVSLPSMVATSLNPEQSLDKEDMLQLKNILNNEDDDDFKSLTEWLLYGSYLQ